MFDGVPAEQLHQFIAASRTSLPLPLSSFPAAALHASSSPAPPPNINNTFPSAPPFDLYTNPSHHHHHHHHHHQLLLQPQPHHHQHEQLLSPGILLHRQSTVPKNHEEKEVNTISVSINSNLEIERERLSPTIPAGVPISDPWSNDELLALLRIRSTMENWFPEFTWEHVSRKLAELGFKRSAEKCKEKFEEESTYFNNINFTKNYRYLSDLEELCQGNGDHRNPEAAARAENKNPQTVGKTSEGDHQDKKCQVLDEDAARNETVVGSKDIVEGNEKEVVERTKINTNKKRKRQRRFEILKGFCEDIVNRMMVQQEELHGKLLENMGKRNEEKLAMEEAWKKQETDRMNKELENMAHEQAVAGDRQATIIKFLKKFVSSSSSSTCSEPTPDDGHATSSSLIQAQNPNGATCHREKEPTSCTIVQKSSTSSCAQNNPTTPTSLTETLAPQSPSSSTLAPSPSIPKGVPISSTTPLRPENPSSDHFNTKNPSSIDDKQDLGKRWPRDEVLALINLRCSLFNNGSSSSDQEKDGGAVKAPLWERISQGMLEMGYKRSAKRCKEKWENINKYFRKTKDVNKKRSLDSRTCPYFHQLSTLYNQGILVPPSDHQGPDQRNCSASPENRSLASPVVPETGLDSSNQGRSSGNDESTKPNIIAEGEKISMVQPVPAAFDFDF